jgi:hypothetical protein
MAAIPWNPVYVVRKSVLMPMRRVLLSNTLDHTIQLQRLNPVEFVALPPRVTWEDVKEVQDSLKYSKLCVRPSILIPVRALDIVYHSPCRHLLIGNILMKFHETTFEVESHEEVLLSRRT